VSKAEVSIPLPAGLQGVPPVRGAPAVHATEKGMERSVSRVGFGYDAHRFVEGRPLILGGVRIPHSMGLLGHSDSDVLTHAIIDALIGALGKGDIGKHFPDDDPSLKNANSLLMLRKVMVWVKEERWRINNVDATVVAQQPKLAPHIDVMKEALSGVLDTEMNRINIKAKTTEGMGFCGREEGMEAFAVVSLIHFVDED
jgi:2-C-methyl-D-erythritol 2,4-cyclodiphosphate synthase